MSSFQPISPDADYIDLSQCWRALKRRWLPACCMTGAVIASVGFATALQVPIYEAEGKLLFNKDNATSALAGLETAELSSITNQGNPLDTQAEIIRSGPLVQRTIDSLELLNPDGSAVTVEQFLGNLKIKAVRGTDILSLSYRSEDAELAAKVVNHLMSLYLDNDVITNRAEAKAAREFITEQLPGVEAQVAEAEQQLRDFQEKNGIVSLSEEATSAIGVVANLEKELTQAQGALADVNRRRAVLQEQLGMEVGQALALSNLNQSQDVKKVLAEYRAVQDELAVERLRYTDNHPAIAHLIRKEAVLQRQLQTRVAQAIGRPQSLPENLTSNALQMGQSKQSLAELLARTEAERLGLADRVAALSEVYQGYRSRLQVIPRLEQTQRQLTREMKAAQATYEQLLTKLQEVQIVENQDVGNAKVMAAALAPTQAIAPRRSRNLALGSFLGLTLGAGTALLLDAKDKSLKTVEDTERALGYSLLGRIPAVPAGQMGQELPVRDNPYSPASAAYEMLQATLDFALPDQTLRRFAVTSALPGEGKSTVSANLAVAMAQMGRRVLLVDADLRRPRQHQIWQVINGIGLSDVLVGRAEFASVVREVLVNVDLLCCGTLPPNPSSLLGSKRMELLLQEWAKAYDCVIIDTPPVTFFPDALKLGRHLDGILPVVRPGLIEGHAATTMTALFEQASQKVLGMVVNATSAENDGESYLYQHSSYYQKIQHPEAQAVMQASSEPLPTLPPTSTPPGSA